MAESGPAAEQSLGATLALLHERTVRRVAEYDTSRAAQRLQDAALRGAAAGLTLRGGLHLVSYLLNLLLRGKKQRQAERPSAAAMLKDTLRWGAFLGSYSGLFVFWDELIAMLGGRKRTRAWRAMVSGTLAGPALLLTGGRELHTSLALYLVIRGLTLLVRCGNLPDAHPLKRKLLAPTRWRHGDIALMCLSTAQIGYSWIVLPQTLPKSYVRFLDKHGGKRMEVYAAVREMASRAGRGVTTGPLASLAGSELARFTGSVPCSFLHPNQGCTQHAVSFWPAAYMRALPVYFPVYVIPAILVHRKRLLQPDKAPELWRKMAVGVLRSSLFLSLYCTLAWRGACAGFNLAGSASGAVIASSCWVAGFAALVEKRTRRMELALYCLSRAAESFALSVMEWGWVHPATLPRRIDVLLFSLASGFILHCYSDHFGQRRGVFRSAYLAVFDFILGNTGFQDAAICHNPSNVDLLLRLESRVSGLPLSRSLRSLSNLAGLMGGNGGSRGGSNPPSGRSSRLSRQVSGLAEGGASTPGASTPASAASTPAAATPAASPAAASPAAAAASRSAASMSSPAAAAAAAAATAAAHISDQLAAADGGGEGSGSSSGGSEASQI